MRKRWAELAAPRGAHMDSFDYDTVNGVIVGANYDQGVFLPEPEVEEEKSPKTLPVEPPRPS